MDSEFETGSFIPTSGIYSVSHSAHKLPSEVALVKSQQFPRCAKCDVPVTFMLIRAVHSSFHPMHIYELPVLDDEAAAAEAAS
jgi:hypothetical protein